MITLPSNNFGRTIMAIVLILWTFVSFALPFWFFSFICPIYISIPLSGLIGIFIIGHTVKFNNKS